MSEKALVIVGFMIAVLPFIIYSFVSDLTKRQFTVLAGITLLLACLASTATGRSLLSWLGQSEHLLPLLLSLTTILVGFAINRFITIRRQRRRLAWHNKPSQREFAAACYDLLIRRGWTHRQELSRLFFNVYWMQLERERITFVVSVGRLEIEALQRLFGSAGSAPAKKVLVVLWERPVDTMQAMLDKFGWRCMVLDDFKQPAANLTDAFKEVARPTTGAASTDSWASLRSQIIE